MNSEGNLLEKYIKEWLMQHEKLTIPNFGTFFTEYQSAIIKPSVHKITPPNKSLHFDDQLKEDDGELLAFLVQQKHLELEDAQSLLKEYTIFVLQDLQNKKKYQASGLGTFFLNPDNSITFQQEEEANLSIDSFGLGAVYTAPISKANNPPLENPAKEISKEVFKDFEEEDKKEQLKEQLKSESTGLKSEDSNDLDEEIDDIVVEEEVIKSKSRQTYTIAALILLFFFVGLAIVLLINPSIFGEKEKQTVEQKKKEIEKEPIDEPEEKNDSSKEEVDAKIKDDKFKEDKKNTPKKEPTPKKAEVFPNIPAGDLEKGFKDMPTPPKNLNEIEVKSKRNQFYVIIASFDNIYKAYSYINNLQRKGFNTIKMLKLEDGKIRISIGEYKNKIEARNKNVEIGEKYGLKSWVLAY
jgi:cell division septation protein DedD/nucleoid DNA-binding protein